MAEIKHQECPHCDSSDAFCYNTEGFGNCFSCKTGYPMKGKRYSDEILKKYPLKGGYKEMNFVPKNIDTDNLVGSFVEGRGITKQTMEFYGVKTYLDGSEPIKQEYVYPSGGKKIRYFPKAFSAENLKSDELFGMNLWNAGEARFVTVCEGELDALSAYQMLKDRYTNPVVSLPSASPSKALWEKCSDWLNSFEKIILSVDNDAAGNAIAAKMANLFPNKVYRVPHDKYKDANEFLQAKQGQAFKNAWYGAKKFVPDNVLNTPDQFVDLFQNTPDHEYVPTGIQALDDKIMGLMQGHFTVIKAPTGVGKTEVMRFLEYNLLQRKVPFATWHLEEGKLRSLLGLVSYHVGDDVTRKDLITPDNKGIVTEAIRDLTKDETFYQYYLPDGQGADELIEQIRFFREACDCKFVFFEPIQDVIAGQTEASKEEMLADLAVRLSKLAAELNVGIVTIAHTNENNEIKYCKMIGQRASVIINIDRDMDNEDHDVANTTFLNIEKNRPCSEVGYGGRLSFDTKSFTLKELA